MTRYTESEFLSAEFTTGETVVEGLVHKGQNILLVAPKKAGKSLISQQLALCVAHGLPFLERWPVPTPRKVVYIAFENTDEDLQRSFRRQRKALNVEETTDRLVLYRMPFLYLSTPAGQAGLTEVLEKDHPDLLIVDPYYRTNLGSVNDDGIVGVATGVLTAAGMKYGHATWLPHHQHRPKKDPFGVDFETEADKYAGNWALGAWCDAMYGFRLNVKTKKAALLNLDIERTPRMGASMDLELVDTDEELLFKPTTEARLRFLVKEVESKSIAQLARELGVHHEEIRRALGKVQKDKEEE